MRDRDTPLTPPDIEGLDWEKAGGLLPAIVQDAETRQVLMLGYMNRAALTETLESGFVTFFSRSKGRLWQKGESSGNRLAIVTILPDCDNDTLLVTAVPAGPTCHLGTTSCFGSAGAEGVGFLAHLSRVVAERAKADASESYTARLIGEGLPRIAQKVGEEGVEIALAAVTRDREGCIEETADLLYHLTVLMEAKGFGWDHVGAKLAERHR